MVESLRRVTGKLSINKTLHCLTLTESPIEMIEEKTEVPNLLLKRNLAEQSKWLNDETGDRSWAKHPTQNLPWMMNVQVEALARGN